MNFWTFLFGLILVIIWIVSAGYLTQASVFLTPYQDKDPELHNAYIFAFSAAFLVWSIVAIFILLLFLSYYGVISLFGSDEDESQEQYPRNSESWSTIIFLSLSLILIIITGSLAAAVASSLNNSPNYSPSISKLKIAYDDSLIAAGLSLGTIGILVIGGIVYFLTRYEYRTSNPNLIEEQRALQQKQLELQRQEEEFEQKKSEFFALQHEKME